METCCLQMQDCQSNEAVVFHEKGICCWPGPLQDSDFIQQIVKAASVAFGGGRPNDYPKAQADAAGTCC